MANEHVDEEFSLKDDGILYPYVRDQRNMNVCYSYSTTEAVSASFARDKNRPPIELSVQQIADHLPIDFQYENKGKEKDDI
ncbi:hypothetical protein KY290_014042 [Solanum tuberosum]|uniref:Peptidase C1A papain C-terminal domain-containing protein n=1 Tax=Solanum tuberosum TaxID=4113 RepID=A0ABQ7VNJ5_SOLTU|nr:hypothetical protein KY289_014140 [Solanum tuberosum]KAH0770061.1 hypothetical protein KY290_014042 [Solanum tuberosum]